MPRNGGTEPIEVRIGKVRNLRPYDNTVAKAVAEAAGAELAALFQSGSRRRTFRVVNGNPAEGGLLVEAAIHELALGEPRENAAMLTFTVVLEATNTRRRSIQSASVDGHASIDAASNPVPQAIRIMQDTLRRGADRFVDGCESEMTRNR